MLVILDQYSTYRTRIATPKENFPSGSEADFQLIKENGGFVRSVDVGGKLDGWLLLAHNGSGTYVPRFPLSDAEQTSLGRGPLFLGLGPVLAA